MLCPICDRDNDADARRCRACGADFEDPEIAAQLVRPAGTGDDEPNLIGDRYLGVRWIGLEVGGDLRRWALLGAIALAIGALMPVAIDLQRLRAAWAVWSAGPSFALIAPLVLAALGVVLATPLGRRLPPAALAGFLVAGGALVIGGVVARLGSTALTATRTWWGVWFGLAVVGAGVMIRVLRRRDPYVRWVVVAGAIVTAIGLLLPYTDARMIVPGEFEFGIAGEHLTDQSITGAALRGFDAGGLLRFVSLWHLAAFVVLGVSVGYALQGSVGPWDKPALVLRPLGWVAVFWLPASFALYAVNVLGWNDFAYARLDGRYYNWDKLTTAMFFGRLRLALLTTGAAAWLVVGLAGIYATVIAPRLPVAAPGATGGPDRTGSAR